MKELDDAFEEALRRFNEHGFVQLDDVDRVLVTIWGLEGDVNNGGFDQYYFNSAGDQAGVAPEALRAIGAHAMAEIVSTANAVFGPDGPSSNRSARQSQLFLVAPPEGDDPCPWAELDAAFFAYPDDISKLLAAFLEARGRLMRACS